MWRRFIQISLWNRRCRQKNLRTLSRIRRKNPHQRRKSQNLSREKRMEITLRKQNRRNWRLKSFERPRMGWRIRITRLSSICYWKSQNHHRRSLKSQLFLIKRRKRLRLSLFSLHQTRQNQLQKKILVQNLQLIGLNHRFRPRLSRLRIRLKSYWLMWLFIRQNCRI